MSRITSYFEGARGDVRLHTMLLWIWVISIPVVLLSPLSTSVPYVIFISVYANVATHWGAREAAKAEVAAQEARDRGR